MPDLLVALMLSLAVAVGWMGVIRLTRGVRHTSLTAAAVWAIWFQVTLTVTTVATLAKGRVPLGILDQLWYLTAVSALCPFVAVLGARRGRLLEWSLFIVLPLIVVLEWPALAQWRPCWNGQRLELESPAVIAYAFLLLMSGAVVCGLDRATLALSFWICTWLAVVSTRWTLLNFNQGDDDVILALAPCGLIVFWILAMIAMRRPTPHHGWERVWYDFQKLFGSLWAMRVALRLNELAVREKWPWQFMLHVVQPLSGEAEHPPLPTDDPRVDHAFRWLLKPFVDPEWIDERLNAGSPPSDTSHGHE